MQIKRKSPDREAVARSLRELEMLFGKKDKGREQAANIQKTHSKLCGNDTTSEARVQAAFGDAS